jgi:uncharacterized protein YjbI with pentapeptide repeats
MANIYSDNATELLLGPMATNYLKQNLKNTVINSADIGYVDFSRGLLQGTDLQFMNRCTCTIRSKL